MRNRLAFLTTLAVALSVLAMTPSAEARTILYGSEGPTQDLYQSWIDHALVPSADVPVHLHYEMCPAEYTGGEPHAFCMDHLHGPIGIWVGNDVGTQLWSDTTGYWTDEHRIRLQLDVMHEVGHVFDYTPRSRVYRKVFARIMGYGQRGRFFSWRLAETAKTIVYPDEQFATAYAFCANYAHYDDAAFALTVWPDMYDYTPTRAQYERVCRLLRDPSAPWARRVG